MANAETSHRTATRTPDKTTKWFVGGMGIGYAGAGIASHLVGMGEAGMVVFGIVVAIIAAWFRF